MSTTIDAPVMGMRTWKLTAWGRVAMCSSDNGCGGAQTQRSLEHFQHRPRSHPRAR